jgi:protocatechuate 3,4-dioxygenase beta subunit
MPVLALALLVGLTASRVSAEDQKAEKGTVSGKVVDKDGNPVADAPVGLFHPMEKGAKSAEKGAEKKKSELAADGEKPKADKGEKPKPVAEATTDKDGAFTMADVPVGDYRAVCHVKGKGNGNQKVTVKAGETATVEIKLGEVQGKKK